VKIICNPKEEKFQRFAKEQEACRKDVEWEFGMLHSRWSIVRHLARTWSHKTMWEVMAACVIMHNLIVAEEHDNILDKGWQFQGDLVEPATTLVEEFLHTHYHWWSSFGAKLNPPSTNTYCPFLYDICWLLVPIGLRLVGQKPCHGGV
jgi:hypothetical protein